MCLLPLRGEPLAVRRPGQQQPAPTWMQWSRWLRRPRFKIIIGTPTPWGNGSLATQLASQTTEPQGSEEFLCPESSVSPGVRSVVRRNSSGGLQHGSLWWWSRAISPFLPNLTDNGIDPNAAGYAIMTPLVETAIASASMVGGGPRLAHGAGKTSEAG